jgi:hypothetical protein
MDDPDFGAIFYGIDAWCGEAAFDRPISGTQSLRIHLRSGTNGPSQEQRQLLHELKRRYNSLWPQIAARIVSLRPDIVEVKRLPSLLSPTVGLNVPGVIGSEVFDFTLVYEFKDDRNRKGYFISFASWSVERADDAM